MSIQDLQKLMQQVIIDGGTLLYDEIGIVSFCRTFLHHMCDIPFANLGHDEHQLQTDMREALASPELGDITDAEDHEIKKRRVFSLLRAWAKLGSPTVRERIQSALLAMSELGRYSEPHNEALDLAHEIQRMEV